MIKNSYYVEKIKNFVPSFRKKEIFEDKEQFQIEINEMNKKEQEHLEKEFMEYKNLGLILFDIIPIKDRKFLIESLKKLFDYDKFTPI